MQFLTTISLKRGSHELPSEGSCAMEVAALAAGYEWRKVQSAADLPPCMSRVIGAYVIGLNDEMPDDERQKLLKYVTRMSGTRGTAAEEQARAEHLVMHAAKPAAVSALRSAGLNAEAENVAKATTLAGLEEAAHAARTAASVASRALGPQFSWQPYLDALEGALAIGPQSPEIETAEVQRRVAVLEAS